MKDSMVSCTAVHVDVPVVDRPAPQFGDPPIDDDGLGANSSAPAPADDPFLAIVDKRAAEASVKREEDDNVSNWRRLNVPCDW